MAAGLTFTQLALGFYTNCGLLTDGSARCWGSNGHGLFGNGTTESSDTPAPAATGLALSALGLGDGFACGLDLSGAAWCWGTPGPALGIAGAAPPPVPNGEGGFIQPPFTTPQRVLGGLVFSSLSVGEDHVCGLVAGGQAYCWGDNAEGQLGDGTTEARDVPTAVAGGVAFRTLAAGWIHTSALDLEGRPYEFGGREFDGAQFTPTALDTELRFTAIATGDEHTCGITTDSAVYCWVSAFAPSDAGEYYVGRFHEIVGIPVPPTP